MIRSHGNCRAMIRLALAFYVIAVPSCARVNDPGNQRGDTNSSLVLSHSIRTSNESKSPSNKSALETSSKKIKISGNILGKDIGIGSELYHHLNNDPGSDLLDYLQNAKASGGDTVNLFAPKLTKHRPWSTNSGSNLLNTHKRLNIQGFKENLSQELKALEPLHWLSNRTGPLNPLSPLKRSRRQADNETGEGLELPRWPGAPQPLRQAKTPQKLTYVKRKILTMMLQSLYSAQERLWPLGPIITKYEHLTPYRMAFIFMKLDQLVHEGHSIVTYLERQDLNKAMTMTRRLQLYSQIMRRNVDVTYLVDYITERVPRDQVTRMRQWVIRHEQEDIMSQKVAYDATYATRYLQRPEE